MITNIQRTLFLALGLIVCAGCGSGNYTNQIDVQLEPDSDAVSFTNFPMSASWDRNRERVFQSPDSSGMVHFTNEDNSALWMWQSRPGYAVFDLFVPSISTNGEFIFHFNETSWLPWRGLKRGAIDTKPEYYQFDRTDGSRVLPAIHTEIAPSDLSGYHITLHLSLKTLRDGTNAEFVPYKH